jgi:hypothetical protein
MRRHRCGCLIALVAVSRLAAQGPAADGPLDRAAAYVERFTAEFRTIISDERYRQRLTRIEQRDGRATRNNARRDIRSEMAFMWLPGERSWITARSVIAVDGKAVPDSRERLERILAGDGAERLTRLRALLDESARFNLGQIRRNFSDATLALQFLDPAYRQRFDFTVLGPARIDGVATTRIRFVERARPTVIRLEGDDLPSSGTLWIADDGAVIRTELQNTSEKLGLRLSIVVTFRRDARLSMWVPSRMEETYEQARAGWWGTPPRSLMVSERIACDATYTNFRRFETGARIVPD